MTTETPTSPDRTINYAFLLGGITALIFGVILLIRGDDALELLAVILGLWWLIHGVFMVFAVFVDREDVVWKLAIGLLGIVAGILVLNNPNEAADLFKGAFGVVLGIIGILVGLSAIFGSFRGGGFGSLVFGLVSGVIGVLVLLNPGWTTNTLITIFAVLLLVDGVAGIYLAIKYK